MDASELLKCYAAGEKDFSGVDLSNANLFRADLGGANLFGANLSQANLIDANLFGANLSNANLSQADVSGANLNQADLSGASLIEVYLMDANLFGANLFGANLSNANLSQADLSEADVSGADLSQADLSEAKLIDTNLRDSNLFGANLIGANLFKADLTNTNLSGAKIDGTILAYQKLSEELQQENQSLTEQVKLLEAQLKQQKLTLNLKQSSNQGIDAPHQWNGFYFRSKTEIKIAEALDRASVLFYPNSKARLNKAEARVNRESDFLVFQAGKFGILEVDGREWHQTAADDHERDRLFKRYGIRVIERFDATRCWNEPDRVVQEFLEILGQA